jgi:DNA-binding LacI/PurR family transcriptional regulator
VNILDKININPRLETTLTQQMHQQLTWLIASGQINPAEKLPSVRLLARHLQVNVNTVRSAYQRLEADGLVKTRQGSGTIVLPYDPHRMALLSGSRRSHTIGIFIPSLTNTFYHPFLEGVEQIAGQNQAMLFVCMTHDDPGKARRYYAQLAAKHVDGILIVSQDDGLFSSAGNIVDEQLGRPLPIVSVDWPASTSYSVRLDLESAGYQATRHLIDHGHRRVGLITHAVNTANVSPIVLGYRRALDETEIAYESHLIVPVHGFDIAAGAEGARQLLALEQPPKAIFAISDLLAIGAMQTIQQAGLQIPRQVAICGFNDIPAASMTSPPLTTVAAPAYQMGQEAMHMLQDLISGKSPRRKSVTLPVSMIIRQSCGEHAE